MSSLVWSLFKRITLAPMVCGMLGHDWDQPEQDDGKGPWYQGLERCCSRCERRERLILVTGRNGFADSFNWHKAGK